MTPQIWSGHTRFATSSHATLEGCHPHLWSPAVWQMEWRLGGERRDGVPAYAATYALCEAYITHNGDLDYFEMHGHLYSIHELQGLLPHVLHRYLPSLTDSCCLAGLFELLRTRGLWLSSVRG